MPETQVVEDKVDGVIVQGIVVLLMVVYHDIHTKPIHETNTLLLHGNYSFRAENFDYHDNRGF